VLGTAFFVLDKLDYIAGLSTGKAVVGTRFGVGLQAGGGIIVEGAAEKVVLVGL